MPFLQANENTDTCINSQAYNAQKKQQWVAGVKFETNLTEN